MATPATTAAPDGEVDLFALAQTPAFQDDPYPTFDVLRSSHPVFPGPLGTWLVSRHADVQGALRDPSLSNDPRSLAADRPESGRADIDQGVMLFVDAPDHTRLRGLVSKAFTPRTVERLREAVRQRVDELLDEMAVRAGAGGPTDLVAELAYPLPIRIICDMLGVPAEDHQTFQGWSRALAASLDPAPLHTIDQQTGIRQAADEFGEYFDALIGRRRAAPGDDLLSGLIAAERDGDRLDSKELRNTGMFLLVAGHETTVNLIGNGVLALLRNPDEPARLRDDPELDGRAVDELLRYDSPVQLTQRFTLRPTVIGGVTVPAGQQLVLLLGAANRDPAAFPDPARLDLARPPGGARHVAFGGGPHFCLGAALARLEGEVAIGTLIRRFPGLEQAGEPTRRATFTLRGLDTLPVHLSASGVAG